MAASNDARALAHLGHWNEALRTALDWVWNMADASHNGESDPARTIEMMHAYLSELRKSPGIPAPTGRDRALALLARRWREHQDDGSTEAFNFSGGMAAMVFALGLISDDECTRYMKQIHECPEGDGNHIGGRAWCAYCGTLHICAYCGHEVALSSLTSCKQEQRWYCDLICRGRWMDAAAEHPAEADMTPGQFRLPVYCLICRRPFEISNAGDEPIEHRYRYCSDECAQLGIARMRRQETQA